MNKGLHIQLYKLLSALSLAMDYNRHGLMRHHQRVAFISLALANEIDLDEDNRFKLFCSAIIHDAGTSTFREKALLEHFEVTDPWRHCQRGHVLLSKARILSPLAGIILHHHDRYDGKENKSGIRGHSIPLPSRIIFLADRIDVLAQSPGNILEMRKHIVRQINSNSGKMFDPELVDAFSRLARENQFWLNLISPDIDTSLVKHMGNCSVIASQEEVLAVSDIFADVIDTKSDFTHRHSRLVKETAVFLADKAGFNQQQKYQMQVAGLLHDLGKLGIDEEILEKPSALSKQEYETIKQHVLITYQILDLLDGFEEIKKWAAYHHEKINGTGYPFGLSGHELPTGSRIMAVADIFSALVENRPYRSGLPRHKVEQIMNGMVQNRAIDGDILGLLVDNYNEAASLQEKITVTGDNKVETHCVNS